VRAFHRPPARDPASSAIFKAAVVSPENGPMFAADRTITITTTITSSGNQRRRSEDRRLPESHAARAPVNPTPRRRRMNQDARVAPAFSTCELNSPTQVQPCTVYLFFVRRLTTRGSPSARVPSTESSKISRNLELVGSHEFIFQLNSSTYAHRRSILASYFDLKTSNLID